MNTSHVSAVPVAPAQLRASFFVDGQNLFHHAKAAFGIRHPNYDIARLCGALAEREGWRQSRVHFYTGMPDPVLDPDWYHYWTAKLAKMGRDGIRVYTRPLVYRQRNIRTGAGKDELVSFRNEKGIDVRLALDVVMGAVNRDYDVACLLSQDQDLSEVAEEIRRISRTQDRWLKIASAFPVGESASSKRGVEKTDWIEIPRSLYNENLDSRDYRRKR